jgi:hypothetical protein
MLQSTSLLYLDPVLHGILGGVPRSNCWYSLYGAVVQLAIVLGFQKAHQMPLPISTPTSLQSPVVFYDLMILPHQYSGHGPTAARVNSL